MKAKLVEKIEDWEFSSFRDYCEMRNGTLCNKTLAFEMMNLNKNSFYEQSYAAIEEKYLRAFRD